MNQEATTLDVTETAAYVKSHLDNISIFSFGQEPEVQVDFHIPCDEEHPHVADTLAALVPCLTEQDGQHTHVATAFKAGEFVQLSLHKEPSVEIGEAFFQEAVKRLSEDPAIAEQVVAQIARNREEQIQRVKERMKRLEALKKKAKA